MRTLATTVFPEPPNQIIRNAHVELMRVTGEYVHEIRPVHSKRFNSTFKLGSNEQAWPPDTSLRMAQGRRQGDMSSTFLEGWNLNRHGAVLVPGAELTRRSPAPADQVFRGSDPAIGTLARRQGRESEPA